MGIRQYNKMYLEGYSVVHDMHSSNATLVDTQSSMQCPYVFDEALSSEEESESAQGKHKEGVDT
jgi:hypothetical protein